MSVDTRVVLILLLLLVTLLSGIKLRWSGRPRNVVLSTVHKLASLGALGLAGLMICQSGDTSKLSAGEIAASVITGVLFLSVIASGGWLSTAKPDNRFISTTHLAAPPLALLAAGVTFYLLAAGGAR